MASLLILGICLAVLTRIEGLPSLAEAKLSPGILASFFVAVCMIYVLSVFLWVRFYALFGENRETKDAFVDMGLIAIGKYLPGKIWGIVARGSVTADGISIKKNRVIASAAEQGYALFVGFILVGYFVLSNFMQLSAVMSLVLLIATLMICAFVLMISLKFLSKLFPNMAVGRVRVTTSLGLALGYIALWLLTSIPMLILILNSQSLALQQLVSVTVAFLGAMIAGWLAVFAPGGIGIRESAFVYLAPEFFTWQTGLFWITLHRALYTLFDFIYGATTLLIIAVRSKLVVLK